MGPQRVTKRDTPADLGASGAPSLETPTSAIADTAERCVPVAVQCEPAVSSDLPDQTLPPARAVPDTPGEPRTLARARA